MNITDSKIAIVGLGYVGLPLAVEFGKKFETLGFDINQKRISELNAGRDSTLEVTEAELADTTMLSFSHDVSDLKNCNVYIVTVPTPIDDHKQPDLTHLIKVSQMLGEVVGKNDIIIYESGKTIIIENFTFFNIFTGIRNCFSLDVYGIFIWL